MMDQMRYSLQNLLNRKRRSLLTILSITIGVMAIFALLSFGLGIQNYVDELAAEAGADKLYIQAKSVGVPGIDDTFALSEEDLEFVAKIKGVAEVAPMYIKVGEVEHRDQRRFTFIAGYDPKDAELVIESFGVEIIKGRQLKKGDNSKVGLGYNYLFADKIFGKPVALGDKIDINDVKFEVVGFFEEVGNPQDDSNVYLTLEGFEALYPDAAGKFAYAMLRADKAEDTEALADKIEEKLRKHKGQEEGKEDFFVQSFTEVLATFGTVINVLNGILVLIALISVVVAAVNIMNTMYTAVLERTKEIGVMKAIGARNSHILLIFLSEAGVLGMFGGVMGVILGYLISAGGGQIAAQAGYSLLKPVFPWYLIMGCIAFAVAVGAGSGILPAYRASKLNPVDALRYE